MARLAVLSSPDAAGTSVGNSVGSPQEAVESALTDRFQTTVRQLVSYRSSSNGASGSSLSPFRSFLRMLNWRRDPAREMRLKQLESEIEQLKKGRVQIEKEIALLDWMHSEIDLIEADLPSERTIAARSSDC